jgi:hypothetical protein
MLSTQAFLNGLRLALARGISEIVIVEDSRIVIQQAQGLINCNQPNLQRKLAEYEVLKGKFKQVRLVHVKREFNQAADNLTSKTLAFGESWTVKDSDEMTHLQLVSKIHEKIIKPREILTTTSQTPDSQLRVLSFEIWDASPRLCRSPRRWLQP